jgi:hypothetical protein
MVDFRQLWPLMLATPIFVLTVRLFSGRFSTFGK